MSLYYESCIGRLNISEPELYVNNQARHRSGHMSHAMVEYAPGKIIDFNSNCSAIRFGAHSAFGFIEYRCSEDYGRTWSDIHIVTPTYETLMDGIYSNSIEKAVYCNGVLTCFALRNDVYQPICCEPWDTPQVIRSYDLGKTWEKPVEFSQWKGRIYDATVRDGVIYVLEFCNPAFVGEKPDDLYRLFVSEDNGETFSVRSVVDINAIGHGYGALLFRPDGSLLAYACDTVDSNHLSVTISNDLGRTWKRQPDIILKYGIRNVQIAPLAGGYVMHGRAFQNTLWGKGQVIYASKDGLNWDDGILLETEKQSCYYSNMLPLKEPVMGEKVLLQYSDSYESSRVNVMHRMLTVDG